MGVQGGSSACRPWQTACATTACGAWAARTERRSSAWLSASAACPSCRSMAKNAHRAAAWGSAARQSAARRRRRTHVARRAARRGTAQRGAACGAPGILAVGLLAVHQVLPELLGHGAVAPVLAVGLVQPAPRAVAQEEQPALLLQDLLLARVARAAGRHAGHLQARARRGRGIRISSPAGQRSMESAWARSGGDVHRGPASTHSGAPKAAGRQAGSWAEQLAARRPPSLLSPSRLRRRFPAG